MRFKPLCKPVTLQTIPLNVKTFFLQLLALICVWGEIEQNYHHNFLFFHGRKRRESRRSCCGLQQPMDCSQGRRHCFVSFLPFHWVGWRSSASCRGGHGWLCSAIPGALPSLDVSCILAGAGTTGCGLRPLECHRHWETESIWRGRTNSEGYCFLRSVPCLNSWDKMG